MSIIYNGFVENFNLVNCYVDTSYYENETIITSKFSNEEEQTQIIRTDFVVVPNVGFKLQPEFSFKIQMIENGEWLEVTQDDFQPLEGELILYLNTQKHDFQLTGIDLNNSLVYEFQDEDKWGVHYYYLFLLGGFNEYKLIFRVYEKLDVYSVETYAGNYITSDYFYHDIVDDYGYLHLGYLPRLNDLMFTGAGGEDLEPDLDNGFFTTYYVDSNILKEIKQKGRVPEPLIINTYSYPIKFNDEQLVESTIKTGYISTEIQAKIFKNNYTSLDIFKFTVPDISDVNECFIRIPFNNDISLDYEDIKGKTIRGYITYEVLTNTTTLFITDDEKILYKNIISLGVEIPYKPNGQLAGFRDVQTRLAYEEPKLYIKGVGKSVKGNYLKGFIKAPNNILKEELDLLNNLLNEGVLISDEEGIAWNEFIS